jgi:hypothetical protein
VNVWEQFVDWFRSVVEPEPQSGAAALETLRPRVLVVNFDPRRPTKSRQPLSRKVRDHWRAKGLLLQDVDSLIDGFLADVRECSAGLVDYQIVQSVVVDGWPVKRDGFCYTWDTFVECLETGSGWHEPDRVDYSAIVRDFGILQRVEADQIDEVWLFGSSYAGFLESIMGGPGAFSCNSGGATIHSPGVSRRFVVMGFNWERGVGEMLEDLGHRFEDCLKETWKHRHGGENLWQRFVLSERDVPGGANVGTLHLAPNSPSDYLWGIATFVLSNCDDWLNFPNFQGTTRLVNCSEWGCPPTGMGDIRAHHKWWFTHLPKAAGQTLGIANNWWLYGTDANAVP